MFARVLGRAGRRAFSTAAAEASTPLARRLVVGSAAALAGAAVTYSVAPAPAESEAARA